MIEPEPGKGGAMSLNARVAVYFGLSYVGQIWFYRVFIWVAPAIAFFLAKRICEELVAGEQAEKVRKAAEEQAKAAFGRS